MTSYQIGELAEKYEVGNRGPGYISNGDKWDPGGDSYGSYQLATKVGTLQGYLKTKLPYVDKLSKLKIKSDAFNLLWKNIAKDDPEGFKQSQFDYVKTISYNPCRKYADKLGFLNTLAVNSALFSISNQHGKWGKILDKAVLKQVDPSLESETDQINNLYDARAKYVSSLTTLSTNVKTNVLRERTIYERKDCLKLVK